MAKTEMKTKDYAILFAVSLAVFYTVLSLLGPFLPIPGGSTIVASAGTSSSGTCSGNLKLSFFPDTTDVGSRASAILSGLNNCNGKVIFVREQVNNDFRLKCSCVVSTGNGCGCAFSVDSSVCANTNFYSQVDMNGNGNYNDPGETTVSQINVNGCTLV
jgi:hypothetical protein